MLISDIKVGSRHRQQLDKIDELAASIRTVGLLHPVVVDSSGNLIAGRRRLAAMQLLGWSSVPVTVATSTDDVHKALLAERDENTCRVDFTPTEAVAMAEAIEAIERKAAEERRRASLAKPGERIGGEKIAPPTDGPKTQISPPPATSPMKSSAAAAAAVGMSRPTLSKAKAVVEAAKADPKRYGDLPAKMDQSRKVDPVHKELVRRKASEAFPAGSRTPEQEAAESASYRFSRAMHDLISTFNSIRAAGGIVKLVKHWSPEQRKHYADELRTASTELRSWVAEIEPRE